MPKDQSRLASLCRYHFGGWYQAVAAAGLKPEGRPNRRTSATAAPRQRNLTTAMLRGPNSSAELERLTGIERHAIAWERKKLGIVRDERIKKNRAWVSSMRTQLGKIPDAEIARRARVSVAIVGFARTELGLPCPPRRSIATSGELGERLRRMPKRELGKLIATLDPIDAKIIKARYLEPRPVTLAQFGAD